MKVHVTGEFWMADTLQRLLGKQKILPVELQCMFN